MEEDYEDLTQYGMCVVLMAKIAALMDGMNMIMYMANSMPLDTEVFENAQKAVERMKQDPQLREAVEDMKRRAMDRGA